MLKYGIILYRLVNFKLVKKRDELELRNVNNKYLIEHEIVIEENFSNYIVTDIERDARYVICILKNGFTYEKTREYLLSKFKTIKNLNFENVTNIINIEIIYSINGIKLDTPQYGYLMEYVEAKLDTQDYFNKCDFHKKLDTFMEICAAINTLNMQGYIFDDISMKDVILIPDSNNNVKVKMKDLLANELRKFNLINSLPYQYNIETREDINSNKDNVVQVVELCRQIFTESELETGFKGLEDIKNIYNRVNTINKSFKLKYFMQNINKKMKKNYRLFISEALNKIKTDLDIIGMTEEIKIVEKNFQRILENKQRNKFINFNGEDGSGKTRLLEEIKYRFENKYFKDIIYIDDFNNKNASDEEKYNTILNYILNKIDKNLRDKYEIYIKKFISILLEKNSTNSENNKQKLQLINRMGKFISEYTMTKPFIMIIDDLDKKNEVFKLFIKYIIFLRNNLENVMIIFSMNESSVDENFIKFINELKQVEKYEEYKINYFNQYNTTKMIRSILNTGTDVNKLAVKIYSETLGNPQYISGVINELYGNGTLYFDSNNGEWKTNIKVQDILIPKSLERRLEASIFSLDEEEINILKELAIFKTPLSEEIILEYVIMDSDNVEIYENLKLKGLLTDKISDQGILIGFRNNLLRNILYLKLSEEERSKLHSKASIFMEKILLETDYYIEELLLHLEKSNSYEKAYFYTLKYAEAQDLLGDISKSISYYKKVLTYPSDSSGSEVAIKIAKLYEKKSNHEKSFEYFEKANQIAIQNDEIEIEIYTLLEMIIIKINSITDIDTGIDYSLNCVRRLLDKEHYPKGEVYYYYALSLKYRLEYNNKLTLLNAQKAIIICEENEIKEDVYGWSVSILISIYIKKGNYKEAKNLCLYASGIFINNNNINGQLYIKLLDASISKEEGKDNKEILEQYLEIAREGNKQKVYKREILSLICIADIYSQEKRYSEAEKYLLRALEREREEGIDSYSFNICNELCLLYIKSGRISLVVKYHNLIMQMQKGLKLLEDRIINTNYTYALYNLMICNYDLAYDHLKKIYALIFNSNSSKYKIVVCNYFELILYKCKNESDIRNVYNRLEKKINLLQDVDTCLEIRISAIRRILTLGYKVLAKELFLDLKGYPKNYNVEGIYVYLELNFRNRNQYNFLINKALRVCSFVDNQEIKADIYSAIGEKYNELECNALALNYYYESIALYIDTINLLPQNDKLSYANNSRFLETRKLFVKCLNEDLGINMSFKSTQFIQTIEDLEQILKELDLMNILDNEDTFKLVQHLYEKCYYNDFRDIYKVFEKFSNNTIDDIKNVMKYMARLILADKAMIVTENEQGENDVICTYRISDKNEINRYLSLKVDSDEDTFAICSNDPRFYQLDDKVLKDGIRSCMYMKIINREKHINSSAGINARLIFITNNALNYINNESKKTIEKFKPFLTFLLEKYNLTISSTLDKLTGVYNRKYFEEALLFLLDSAKARESEFAVIMFDIDDFKGVNDKYGHQTGDEVLVKVANEVKKCMSKGDIIGRYGGEEFIILLPNVNCEAAINSGERIRKNIEEARILGDKRKVTVSIGIAMSSYESLNNEEIIRRADQALYKAKRDGKNRCIVWENECGTSGNTNDELTGVLSGNAAKDYNFMLMLKEIAGITKRRCSKEEKLYNLILKIMQTIECDVATIFIVKEKKVVNTYSKRRNKDNWNLDDKFNFKLVNKVIEEEKGLYLVDWESMDSHNSYGLPDWKSVCIAPIICNGELLAVVYLSISVNEKEFICNDYNVLNFLIEIGSSIFLG
ncbi:diguanylate cyclase [Clostridium beijerinckii]|uniref:diguanylate cyclase n=1 Tax=Clostridium beijerinckii TaxID=1520 RepID=UPI00232FE488|nr:diguanylate cyclase [Clostridium beijerinckii]